MSAFDSTPQGSSIDKDPGLHPRQQLLRTTPCPRTCPIPSSSIPLTLIPEDAPRLLRHRTPDIPAPARPPAHPPHRAAELPQLTDRAGHQRRARKHEDRKRSEERAEGEHYEVAGYGHV